jgi:UDP-N-acetylglucosamine acyltransferase
MSNLAQLAGHCIIEDNALIGGMAGLHQFTRVGRYAFVGGDSKVTRDVPPFFLVEGNPATPYGLNSVGLRRANFTEEERAEIKKFYKLLNGSKLKLSEAIDQMRAEVTTESGRHILSFLEGESQRGILLK